MEFVTSPFAIRTVLWWCLGKTGTEPALFAVVRRRSDDPPSVREFILGPRLMRDARSSPHFLPRLADQINVEFAALPHFFLWRHRGATILYHFLSVIVIKLKSNA